MKIVTLIFSAIFFYGVGTFAEQVTLYSAEKEEDFCDWKIREQLLNKKTSMFVSNAYPCNKVCGKVSSKWFITSPGIKTGKARSLNITLTLLLDYRSRNPTAVLLAAQTKSGKALPYQFVSLQSKKLIDYMNSLFSVSSKTDAYLNVGLALPDLVASPTPECLTIAKATITYNKCSSTQTNMATFPDVVAPGDGTDNRVRGKCKANTVPVSSDGVWLYCDQKGAVSKVFGCQCQAGFEKISENCSICLDGTYKGEPGNHKCSKCGKGSISSRNGTNCPCVTGSREEIGKKTSSDDCKNFAKQKTFIILLAFLVIFAILDIVLLALLYRAKKRLNNQDGERQALLGGHGAAGNGYGAGGGQDGFQGGNPGPQQGNGEGGGHGGVQGGNPGQQQGNGAEGGQGGPPGQNEPMQHEM